MAAMNVSEALQRAVQHHQAGRLPDAEAIYRQILAEQPNQVDTLHLLGVLAGQMGHTDAAMDLIRRAIGNRPLFAEAYSNLGRLLAEKGRLEEALTAYSRVVQLRPTDAVAYNTLGITLRIAGQTDQAVRAFSSAIQINPKFAEAHNNLGLTLFERGKLDEGIIAYRKALTLKPKFSEAQYNLGNALREKGQLAEAVAAFREAIIVKPSDAMAHNNLGNALIEMGLLDEAIAAYRRALSLSPVFAGGYINLGGALRLRGQLDEAMVAFQSALALDSNSAAAFNSLGNVLKDSGQLSEAIAAYRKAVALDPSLPDAHSNLVYTLHFHPDYDPKAIYEEASHWNQNHAAPLAQLVRPHDNNRDPERPLRVGYISADFRQHPLAENFLPLALCHDSTQFRMVCYSSASRPDSVTERLRNLADEWREVANLSDAQLAELVRQDKIDILVDLALHTADNRLLVFARKPAPVQVTCLCNIGTTGLQTMDYRISDRYSDPPGFNEAYYSEETVRLPDSYLCREPPSESPPVGPVPSLNTGYITFGCLNNFCKVTPQTLDVWGQILAALPKSRLILRCPAGATQQRVRDTMAKHGIGSDRIEFCDRRLAAQEYLRLHDRMDIYLDPFPYSGHTSSLDALWMGVPLITLAGQADVGRSGLFLLPNLGMEELIAQTQEEYVRKAIELAGDLPRMGGYRSVLRQRLLQSPLMDTKRFASNMEEVYRLIWRKWCAEGAKLSMARRQ